MKFYKITYSKNAEKFINKNKVIGIKFIKAFTELTNEKENSRLYDIKKIYSKEYNDIFRLRIGDYRAIFRVIDNELIIHVFNIDSRGNIYKKNV